MGQSRMGESWEASLSKHPVRSDKRTFSLPDQEMSEKPKAAVGRVQSDLVAHLQRAFPVLDAAIVQLIVENQGEDRIDEAVKALSSLAEDAEKEAAASRIVDSHHHAAKESQEATSTCVDDKVAMDMAIAASLADQKLQQPVCGSLAYDSVAGHNSGGWGVQNGWEAVDPVVAAEWGIAPPGQGLLSDESSLAKKWETPFAHSVPDRKDVVVSGLQGNTALLHSASWDAERIENRELLSDQVSAKPPSKETGAADGPGVQAMAAILGDDWAKEPSSGHNLLEKRDPAIEQSMLKSKTGKARVKPYTPKGLLGAGKQEGIRPYSPHLSDKLVETKRQTDQPSISKLDNTGSSSAFMLAKREASGDDEAEVLKQLKAMFPKVDDNGICKAYVDADSDANRAADVLSRLGEERPVEQGVSNWGDEVPLDEPIARHRSLELLDNVPLSEEPSECHEGKASPRKQKAQLEVPVQGSQLLAKGASPAACNLVPSRQHPNPFQESDSDIEHSASSHHTPDQLPPPVVAGSSADNWSDTRVSGSSGVTSPESSPRLQRRGRRKGSLPRRGLAASSSDEEAKATRADMMDFMVSMLGESVPVAVVADVLENFKGDFQKSLKCLLSMSAGSEGGLLEEDFGAITDGSEGSMTQRDLSRASSDGEEEDPLTTLVNIFGGENMDTIEQVLKERGGDVGEAATVLAAMFESQQGDSAVLEKSFVEEPLQQEEASAGPEDSIIQITLEQLMAHFPLADKSAVRSLLLTTDNSFDATAKLLYESGLMPRGLDVASLSGHQGVGPSILEADPVNHSQQQPSSPLAYNARFRPVTSGRGRRPGAYEVPPRHPQAHLQPLFNVDEFPEIGRQVYPEPTEQPEYTGHNALFLKNRSATNKHWRACSYYFAEAARARANREYSRAEALKEQGHKHKRLAEAANQVASSKIFSEKNKTIRNTVKIDVHGQLVQEALGHVDDHLKSLAKITTISHLSIITGRGLHSENGKAKILPAVRKYLTDRGYTFYQENPGCIVVDLKAERQVPSGLSSAEDAEDRPSSAESYEERVGRAEGNGQASYRKLNVA